jgi:indole-3-glycerol phosphate synthase
MEVHPEKKFIPKGASIFGINSRRFKTAGTHKISNVLNKILYKDLTIDLQMHFELYDKLDSVLPGKKTVVAESGINEASTLDALIKRGFAAALIGTAFLRRGTEIETVLESYSSFIKVNEPKLAKKLQLQYT